MLLDRSKRDRRDCYSPECRKAVDGSVARKCAAAAAHLEIGPRAMGTTEARALRALCLLLRSFCQGDTRGIIAERRAGRKKCGPRIRVGQRSGGPRAHRSMKRVSSAVRDGRQKGVGVRISKNVSEQFQPMNRRQLANAGEHVGKVKRLGKKTVRAGGETCLPNFGRAV